MKLDDALTLIEFLEDEGYNATLYEDYSGRCMYGNVTVGVTTDMQPVEMEEAEEQLEEGYQIDYSFRSDNMGLDYIYY